MWHLQGRAEIIKDLEAAGALTSADREPPLQWEGAIWRLWVQLRHAHGNGGYSRDAVEAHAQREHWHIPRALRHCDHLQAEAMSFKADD